MRSFVRVPLAVAIMMTASCANNEQAGQLTGGVVGASIGTALGKVMGNDRRSMQLGAVFGGITGVAIGGSIGRSLDARDQQRASYATQTVLARPAPYVPATYAPTRSYPPSSPSTPASEVVKPTRPPVPRAPSAQWVSDHSGATGSATVISVQPPTASSGECRTVREIAYSGGEERVQDQRYCRDAASEWQKT